MSDQCSTCGGRLVIPPSAASPCTHSVPCSECRAVVSKEDAALAAAVREVERSNVEISRTQYDSAGLRWQVGFGNYGPTLPEALAAYLKAKETRP